MATELEILGLVSDRLAAQGLDFMLTGSFALAFYATPRMTRDLDFVVALKEPDVEGLAAAFAADFYIDADAARTAIRMEHIFNLMHLASGIKVDLIVRKVAPYRRLEFSRRQAVDLAGIQTWIVSREDLTLSSLVWARDGGSELQLRDVPALLEGTADTGYLQEWTTALGVTEMQSKADALKETSAQVEVLVTARYRAMTPAERCQIASAMYDEARVIVESSLPAHLTGRERRLALAMRMYGKELPPAALDAFAAYEATSHEPTGPITSPCVGICCIGADGLCFGCFRNRAELSAWRTASEMEKREILVQCQLRQREQGALP